MLFVPTWSARARASKSPRRAAAALEFAIVSLVFFPMVLGIIEIGRGLCVVHLLNVAACKGCRTAILEGNDDTIIKTAVKNVLNTAGIANVSDSNITVQVNNATANASTAKMGDEVTVNVSIALSQFTWVPGGNYLKGSLSGQYTLVRE